MSNFKDNPEQPAEHLHNLQKQPEEWKTGHDPMTDAQASHLQTLAGALGKEAPINLSKSEAGVLINDWRARMGLRTVTEEEHNQMAVHNLPVPNLDTQSLQEHEKQVAQHNR